MRNFSCNYCLKYGTFFIKAYSMHVNTLSLARLLGRQFAGSAPLISPPPVLKITERRN